MTRKISDCHYVLNLLPVKHLQNEILAELIGAEGRGVEPHTHTKRHVVFFVVMASGMARGRVRRTSVTFHDILT